MDTFLIIRLSDLTVALHTKHEPYRVQDSQEMEKLPSG